MNVSLRIFESEFTARKKYPLFKAGDTIEVICEYEEGQKKTFQSFIGIVIQRKHPNTSGETFTVRKISDGVAVEKILPILSQTIKEIKIIKFGIVHQARVFYIRDKKGKDLKIKTKFIKTKKDLKKQRMKTYQQVKEETTQGDNE